MTPLIEISRIGAVRATPIQNRRCMLASSGFSPSSRLTVRGSRAIPQIGHAPGPFRTISGCIGQVYVTPMAGAGAAGVEGGAPPVYLAGSARNFSRQRGLQKYHVLPPYSYDAAARAGSTVMPHTGSLAWWLTIANGEFGWGGMIAGLLIRCYRPARGFSRCAASSFTKACSLAARKSR